MGQAIGGILPLALGVVIGVLPVIAIILILITPRARSNGGAFVAGWGVGVVVVRGGGLLLAQAVGGGWGGGGVVWARGGGGGPPPPPPRGGGVWSTGAPSRGAYAIKLALGI